MFPAIVSVNPSIKIKKQNSQTFLGELGEEKLGKPSNLVYAVDNAAGHVADLTLHLDHVVQNEVSQDGQGVGSHAHGVVVQPGVHTRSPGLHGVWEPEGHVPQGDDEVGPDDWLHRPLQDSEQQLEMTLAELAGDQHELGERQAGAGPEVGVRELAGVGADVENEWSDGGQQSVAVQQLLLTDLGKGKESVT